MNKSIYAYVSSAKLSQSKLVGWVGSINPAFAASGWVDGANPAYGTWDGAHEADHIMKLKDRYDETTPGKTTPHPGWENTIMAQRQGAVTPADRQGALDALGCDCQCEGGK